MKTMSVKQLRRDVRGKYEGRDTRVSHVVLYITIGTKKAVSIRVPRSWFYDSMAGLSPKRELVAWRVKKKLYIDVTHETCIKFEKEQNK